MAGRLLEKDPNLAYKSQSDFEKMLEDVCIEVVEGCEESFPDGIHNWLGSDAAKKVKVWRDAQDKPIRCKRTLAQILSEPVVDALHFANEDLYKAYVQQARVRVFVFSPRRPCERGRRPRAARRSRFRPSRVSPFDLR